MHILEVEVAAELRAMSVVWRCSVRETESKAKEAWRCESLIRGFQGLGSAEYSPQDTPHFTCQAMACRVSCSCACDISEEFSSHVKMPPTHDKRDCI